MSKIDLTTEILKHPDHEVIEFLSNQMSNVSLLFAQYKDPSELVGGATTVGLVYGVLKEMDRRNKAKNGQNDAVVL